ncbi:MAG TPA: lamin tail domain-containing protein, partial [Chthoniobacteraceae bacterium]|nr:lamin tail domain-containing protein [Chthoniobacteraceae bacterium]
NWVNAQTLVADVGDPATVEPTRTVINLDTDGDTVNDRMTLYFRKTINFPGSPVGATIRMQHVIDDGAVFYVNGQEVQGVRFNMAAGQVTYSTAASSSTNPTYSTLIPIPASYFVPGDNVIAVEVHQISAGNSDICFGLKLEGTIPYQAGDVSFNEICADNQGIVSNGGTSPDYIEIYNRTFQSIDMSGWSLSDDVLVPGKYIFPAGIVIPAQGRVMVWCDSDFAAPGLHAGFGLSKAGQTLALFQGNTVRDSITFGPQARNFPIGRALDGDNTWTLVNPSPDAPNLAATLGSSANLKFNEWMAAPATGEDWFEVYNSDANPVAMGNLWLSDTSGDAITQIPPFSYIEGKGFTEFEADGTTAGGNHCNFKLSTGGDNLILLQSNGTTVITSRLFGLQQTGVSQGLLPDGGTNVVSFPQTPSPDASNYLPSVVVINEALTNSAAPFEDAIELRNTSGTSVDLGGWWLSDDESNLQKFQFPAGTTIPGNGYLVIYENQFNTGPNAFSLSSTGEEVILTAVDSGGVPTGTRAQVSFGAAAENVSFGRVNVAGGAEFWPNVSRTFGVLNPSTVEEFRTGTGVTNSVPKIGPIIVNEVMYHPPEIGGVDNSRDEFVELLNSSAAAVDMSGWRLKGASDFIFPAGTILQSGEYALVVSFDPANTGTLDSFRGQYGLGTGTRIFGPYSPKLSNSTQSVEIGYPGPAVGSETPFINVEKVEYVDFAPWPVEPDGSGTSLQRQSRNVIGNDAANWVSATPTPYNINPGQTPFDPVTETPILNAPVNDVIVADLINVSFTFPEAPLNGSAKLSFVSDSAARHMSLAPSVQTAGTHSFSFSTSDPNAAAEITGGGSSIPDGVYAVTIGYQDQAGNPGASASATNVRIDRTAPLIDVPDNFTVLASSGAGAIVSYDPSATDVGGSGVLSVVADPASGSALPLGDTTVQVTATDLAGNSSTASFVVTVNAATLVTTVRFSKGDTVPGAGTLNGPPADAAIASFGEPAIDDSGVLAFLARWKSASGSGSGIFTDNACVARVKGQVPGVGGATFKAFSDPVFAGGRLAFLAALGGVPKAQSTVVMSDAVAGALAVVARAGEIAPDSGGATFQSFKAVAVAGDRVA